jgi:hypothetical protein
MRKPILGFEGYYEVSDTGQVFSLPRITSHGHSIQGLELSPKVSKKRGYLMVQLFRDGNSTCRWVHTLVLEAFCGPRPRGMECRHLDGLPSNNCISNLKWGTPAENAKDRVRHGVTHPGESSPFAKLSNAEVLSIRAKGAVYVRGIYQRLAKEYNVGDEHIRCIIKGTTWRHLLPQST